MRTARRHAVLASAALAACLLGAAPALAGPPNDKRSDAERLATLPAAVVGTTQGARREKSDPAPACATADRTVWYRVDVARATSFVVRLHALGRLDAVVAVYRRDRSHLTSVTCKETDGNGRAVIAFYGHKRNSFLVLVGERSGSPSGTFRLQVVAAERQPRPPGTALTGGIARSTVDAVLDQADAWSVSMQKGSTYRINLTSPRRCLSLSIYRPGVYSFRRVKPVQYFECGGYTTFTPGPDGGGTYSLVVGAEEGPPALQPYRLEFAPAGVDDTGPGASLENGEVVRNSLFGRGLDVVDLYNFDVAKPNELTSLVLRARPNVGFDMLLLRDTGRRVDCACGSSGALRLREHLRAGHYFVAVRSRAKSGGRYRLQLLIRSVTTTSVLVSGSRFAEAPPGTSVSLTVHVTSAERGGPVRIQIDRLDPLAGWQFSALFRTRVGASGFTTTMWTPPSVGYWRVHASFVGTPFASFSESRSARLYVSKPLGP
jgi:hypothetical protein